MNCRPTTALSRRSPVPIYITASLRGWSALIRQAAQRAVHRLGVSGEFCAVDPGERGINGGTLFAVTGVGLERLATAGHGRPGRFCLRLSGR